MHKQKKYLDIINHYEQCFEKHGDTAKGHDWPKDTDLDTRHTVMLDCIRGSSPVTLLDFGCGTGMLLEFIQRKQLDWIDYIGVDLSHKFVDLAQKKFPNHKFYTCDILDHEHQLPKVDYVVANGICTVKHSLTTDDMWSYTQKLLPALFDLTKEGLACNFMSKHVDWEREDLFHMPLDQLASFSKQQLTRHYILRNDYGLYEFTAYFYRKPWLTS